MKFGFLKSKRFWLTVAHVSIIGAGAAASVMTGNPIPLAISGAVNGLMKSPLQSDTVSPSEIGTAINAVETIAKHI